MPQLESGAVLEGRLEAQEDRAEAQVLAPRPRRRRAPKTASLQEQERRRGRPASAPFPPHAAAGTAKAAADAWELARALREQPDFESALRAWEPGQLELGRKLLERTRRIGRRSQVDCNWMPGDPELVFGLYEPGR